MTPPKIRRPLATRIAIFGFSAVLFASCTIGGLAWYRQTEMSRHTVAEELEGDLRYLSSDMKAQERAASAVALAIAGEPETAPLILSNAHDAIVARYAASLPGIVENGALQLMTFIDASGKAVARIHEPTVSGDDMTGRRKTVATALKDGKLTAGVEPGRTAVAIFASAPVKLGESVVGVVDVGTSLKEGYFKRIAAAMSADIAIHVLKDGVFERQSSTFAAEPPLTPEQVKASFEGTAPNFETVIGDKTFAVTAIPLQNFSGANIGVIEIASDITALATSRQAALWSTIVGTILVSGLCLLGFLVFARQIAVALRNLTTTMSRLAGGDLSAEVLGKDRPDEIGAMAGAVEVFKQAAVENRRLEAEAAETHAAQASQRNRQSEIETAKAEDLRDFVHAVDAGFDALSDGDLTVRMTASVAPEFEPIREKFNDSVAKLETAIGSVVGAVGTIRSGLSEISIASNDLAQRTEQQAASLEETVAALGEVTSAVNETATGAGLAKDAAAQAQKNAEKGGEIVGRAVAAMAEIEKSSDQIGKIIGVIDEIAFQTNLLALNAGVEAARAGEAGRGFAVVAQEVRGLAQRSAEAAKEIKTLIAASGQHVERGVDLVTASGQSLEAIVRQVADVSDVVSKIANGAHEQAIALREVSVAADQMDKVTQQNAAMVEETTAAAQSLSADTDDLARLTEGFRTAAMSSAGTHTRSARRPAPRAAAPVTQLRSTGTGGAARRPAAASATEEWEDF